MQSPSNAACSIPGTSLQAFSTAEPAAQSGPQTSPQGWSSGPLMMMPPCCREQALAHCQTLRCLRTFCGIKTLALMDLLDQKPDAHLAVLSTVMRAAGVLSCTNCYLEQCHAQEDKILRP